MEKVSWQKKQKHAQNIRSRSQIGRSNHQHQPCFMAILEMNLRQPDPVGFIPSLAQFNFGKGFL